MMIMISLLAQFLRLDEELLNLDTGGSQCLFRVKYREIY